MLVALGDAYLEKGLYAEAAKRYNQLLELDLANPRLYHKLSLALIHLKNFGPEALRIYEKAIHQDPHDTQISRVLAQSFLSEKRSDAKALEVYELVLQNDPSPPEALVDFLIDIYYSQGAYDKCKRTGEKRLTQVGFQVAPLNLYLDSCWKLKDFAAPTNLLKKLIDITADDTLLLRRLCETYLEKRLRTGTTAETLRFSFIDRQHIIEYLTRIPRFNRLQDLVFSLELKGLLADNEVWGLPANLPAAEEQELAYSYATSGESHPRSSSQQHRLHLFDFGEDVLSKLHALEEVPARSQAAKSSLTYDDFQEHGIELFSSEEGAKTTKLHEGTDILITIEFSNFDKIKTAQGAENLAQLRRKIWLLLADFVEKYKQQHLWSTSNGLLILTKNLVDSVYFAIDILNKVNHYNALRETKEQIHLAVGIHHSKEQLNAVSHDALGEICTAIKLATVSDSDLLEEDKPMYGKVLQKSDRIFLSARAYREIKSASRFKVNALGNFRLRYQRDPVSIYEISWRNPVEELRFGYIHQLGRFELLAEIGGNQSMKVYKAKDADLQRFVILKVVQSESFNALPSDNQFKQDFYRISRIPSQFNHPNIVKIYDVDEDRGLTYVAREYVEGQNLSDLCGNHLGIERVIKIIYQVFKALQYTHRFGLFHLNLKPNNILVDTGDHTKIMDFLLPRSLFMAGEEMAEDRDLLYVAPEQIRGEPGDARSDIFSMGVIMYEAITQVHPFADSNEASVAEAILRRSPSKPSARREGLPKFFDALILKCLEKHPEKRFQTAEYIVTLLKKNFERTLFSNFSYQIAQSRDAY